MIIIIKHAGNYYAFMIIQLTNCERSDISFNNNKPWFTVKLKKLRHTNEDAYRSGDKILHNHARNRLSKDIKVAKRSYSAKLKKSVQPTTHQSGLA